MECPVSRNVGNVRGQKAKADRLFSLVVRSRGRCEKCGKADTLQTAHIISRRYVAIRTDEANAFCLCAACHYYFTDHPVEFASFVGLNRGHREYERLLALTRTPTRRFDWAAEVERLTARCAELGIDK